MALHQNAESIKLVGINGQICLGKEYAGKQIQISKLHDGTLLIKPGTFVPDNEKWIHTKENSERIDKAIKWAESTTRHDNFDEIQAKIESDE